MNAFDTVPLIQQKFAQFDGEATIPFLREGNFTAQADEQGVWVNNLGTSPFLPWSVFEEAVSLLISKGGRATRGDAMACHLGDAGLPFDSLEGHIAHKVYGKQIGDIVFRRITPIACILIWAGICSAEPGELVMIKKTEK